MKKSTLNFIINALMFICMSAVVGIGFLIKYTLISGKERNVIYGKNVELSLFGMDRHEWGNIHLVIAFILLGLLVIHLFLHWKTIISVYKRITKQKLVSKLITVSFITICTMIIVVPFFTNPTITSTEHNDRRQATITVGDTEESDAIIEIRGYMTLDEISKKYKVPAEFIKSRLRIPTSFNNRKRLSSLRKEYGIKMDEVEKIIKDCH